MEEAVSDMIAVSIIVPVYNAEAFLRQCLDSLKEQRLSEGLEFICVDDGSTDGSQTILKEYASRDPRFVVIRQENRGYGAAMNRGLSIAKGKYVGILESDDYAEPDIYEKLYHIAEKHQVEVVRGCFAKVSERERTKKSLYPEESCDKVIRLQDFPEMLYGAMAIWTGLYNKDFLDNNTIQFLETKGASYQDTSFWFMVWLCAKQVYLIKDAVVNYRVDNESSSVHDSRKVFCLCDEFAYIEKQLAERDITNLRIWQIETSMKYIKYLWNEHRIASEFLPEFHKEMQRQMWSAYAKGYVQKKYLTDFQWDKLRQMLREYALGYMESKNENEMIPERQIPKAILGWYPFAAGRKALYVGHREDPLAELLEEQELKVTAVELKELLNSGLKRGIYDYVVAIGCINGNELSICLEVFHQYLSNDGILLLGMDNPLGLRFFCGDWSSVSPMINAHETENRLQKSGFLAWNRFSVFPRLEDASHLFLDGYTPQEDLSDRIIPSYYHPASIFKRENGLYNSAVENNLFHTVANAYLYECGPAQKLTDFLQITSSFDRGKENATITVIKKSGNVEKWAAFPDGEERIYRVLTHAKELKSRGIRTVSMKLEEYRIQMPYIDAPTGGKFLKELLGSGNTEEFLGYMDRFQEIILGSSEKRCIDGMGYVMENAYIDLIPLNSFFANGEFVVFDQEFCEKNYPANVIVCRMIDSIYSGDSNLQQIYPKEKLYARYGILDEIERWKLMAAKELRTIRNEAVLVDYHRKNRVDARTIVENANRNRYGKKEYQRRVDRIFDDIQGKDVYLFGAGQYTRRFLNRYNGLISIKGIIDNDTGKKGMSLECIPVIGLEDISNNKCEVKIIVCVKNHEEICLQLETMGFWQYSIYEPNRIYKLPDELKKDSEKSLSEENTVFDIGYVAGVFDLFHRGHLNLFKRAKSRCRHLIVGICSDEWVRGIKKTEPVIPFGDRIALVRGCRYVDEAVRIPPDRPTSIDAWNRYHFDVQFSGSDYVQDKSWLKAKEELEKKGSTIVFFPYTESVSTTMLKQKI
ncbi:MAG: glycosyltransferase [Lachnospiraceae bacterium]|nr:glycosyltransferase [Lachnospiraceae bacterium]